MQALADQISELHLELSDLRHQVLGQQHAINIVLTGLKDADEEAYLRTMGRLESVRDAQLQLAEQGHVEISKSDQSRAKRAFRTIAEQLNAIVKFDASPEQQGITLTVISGGRDEG